MRIRRGGYSLKIKRAFRIFDGGTFHGVGVNHGGFKVAMPKHFLNRPDVIIRLEQVTGR